MRSLLIYSFFLLAGISVLIAQQIPDTSFNPGITSPTYTKGEGPVVFIDEGHYNFHTKDGRYTSFARLLERDGYQVLAFKGEFTKEKLIQAKILVISNALHAKNEENWFKPVYSAFTQEEIQILSSWVKAGGSLWLIADHMPLAGAAIDLGKAFDFDFTDGFVMDTTKEGRGPDLFRLEDKTLVESSITRGREGETVTAVASFTGQAFQLPTDAKAILTLDKRYVNLLPDTAWVFSERTHRQGVEGWSQGAYKKFGKGRVVAFGEAAMFSAQLAGPNKVPMGMNHPLAKQNYQLLLNIIHWLDRLYD